ncbi:MAG: DUF4147 domain-containing protein [Acidimicrobiia bacterium]|nr:DUF4147 domain-containing protein [Acidimicrobiia bacterium]
MLSAYRSALEAVDPEVVTRTALDALHLPSPIHVIAIGKAAAAMARGASTALPELPEDILVISDRTSDVPMGARLVLGSHPSPDERSEVAGRAALYAARTSDPEGSIVFLVSGGGSSIAEVPAPGLTVADLAETARVAMAAGMPIDELNTVRRHLSFIKNGRLATAARSHRLVTIAISDVVDAPPSAIASGPTLDDGSTAADALGHLGEHDLLDSVPTAVVEHLENAQPQRPLDADHDVEVVADGHRAASAAVRRLDELGIPARAITEDLTGFAIASARSMCGSLSKTVAVVTGETTMQISGEGRGGRNQSAALAAASALDGGPPAVFAALATDGIDGPTDAAGAIVDHNTASRIRDAGMDPQKHLGQDDAYPALASSDDLVITGPSGTNVSDLWMGWRETD